MLTARVINLSDESADVTLLFWLGTTLVRQTFLQIPSQTSTTVVGPDRASLLEVKGTDETGDVLPAASFRYGVEFNEGTQAEYIIGRPDDDGNQPPRLIFWNHSGPCGWHLAAHFGWWSTTMTRIQPPC